MTIIAKNDAANPEGFDPTEEATNQEASQKITLDAEERELMNRLTKLWNWLDESDPNAYAMPQHSEQEQKFIDLFNSIRASEEYKDRAFGAGGREDGFYGLTRILIDMLKVQLTELAH